MGNCQAGAVASAMRLLLPGASVETVSAYRAGRRFRDTAALRRHLAGYDLVFASRLPRPLRDGGDLAALREGLPLIPMPVIVFGAFHPDVVYVDETRPGGSKRHIAGPMGTYHSALLLFAHRQGWDAARAARLFDPALFRRLGYLDMWAGAMGTLLQLGREAEYPLDAAALRWTRRGAFMHLVNHPRMFVAADLARGLLDKAGLAVADCDLDTFLLDEFLPRGSWPVHPAVAAEFGLTGHDTFLPPARRGQPARALPFPAFVEASLAAFARHPAGALTCERVDAWCRAPDLVADLAAATA